MSDLNTLRVLLNADPEQVDYQYAGLNEEGAVITEGISDVASLPLATNIVLIIPTGSVTVTKVKLPPGIKFQSVKFNQMLPAAVEDQILSDMSQVHVVAGMAEEEGYYPVAIVDKAWLHAELEDFLRMERPVTAIVPEVLFGAVMPGVWSLTVTDTDSILRTDSTSVVQLDNGGASPPVGLTLRLRQLSEEERPEKLLLFTDRVDIDIAAWEAGLGLIVEVLPLSGKPRWMVEPTLPSINLATKEFLPQKKKTVFSWERFKVPVILAGVLLTILVVDLSISLIKKVYEKNRLESEIAMTFQSAFPDIPISSNPIAQMRSEVTQLKHRVGEQGPNDFLPMLSILATVLSEHGIQRVEAFNFELGSLTCRLGAMPTEEVNLMIAELERRGYEAIVDVADSQVTLQMRERK